VYRNKFDYLIFLEAAHTFFTSIASKTAMVCTGKYNKKCVTQRRRNRKIRRVRGFFGLIHVCTCLCTNFQYFTFVMYIIEAGNPQSYSP